MLRSPGSTSPPICQRTVCVSSVMGRWLDFSCANIGVQVPKWAASETMGSSALADFEALMCVLPLFFSSRTYEGQKVTVPSVATSAFIYLQRNYCLNANLLKYKFQQWRLNLYRIIKSKYANLCCESVYLFKTSNCTCIALILVSVFQMHYVRFFRDQNALLLTC
jgi:hypothetical protein